MTWEHANGPGAGVATKPSGAGGMALRLPGTHGKDKPASFLARCWGKVAAGAGWLDSIDRSFFLFSKEEGARFRPWLIQLTSSRWYKAIVMTIVISNVVYLGTDDPTCDAQCMDAHPQRKMAFFVLDLFYTISFTIDVVAQALALNFILGPGAYLKNGWSWIDFLTTATGYMQYLPLGSGGGNLSGIRALRALRPLRALNSIPGLRKLVQTLLMSLPLLMDVLLLLMWIFAVFGIVALQIFQGSLMGRCEALVEVSNSEESSAYAPLVPPMAPPAAPDDLNATLSPPASGLRRLVANLYSVSHRQLLRGGGGGSGGGGGGGGGGSQPTDELQVVSGLENWPCALITPGLGTCPEGSQCLWTDENPNYGYTSFNNFGSTSLIIFQMLTLCNWCDELLYPLMNAIGPGPSLPFTILLILFGSYFAMQLLIAVLSSKFAQIQAETPQQKKKKRKRRGLRRIDTDDLGSETAVGDPDDPDDPDTPFNRDSAHKAVPTPTLRARVLRWRARLHRNSYNAWVWFHGHVLTPTKRRDMSWIRLKVYNLCHHPWFGHAATICIVINTIVFAIQFADQPEAYTNAMDMINTVLTGCFIAEFAIKHAGLGYVRYWSDRWNILDGVIVLLSITEIILSVAMSGSGAGKLQALRTFRVLRILRSLRLLARVPALKRLMTLVIKGMVALKDFFLLLGLFIYIFAILGFQLFGGNQAFSCGEAANCRYNFDSLWESLYTSFQVLCLDDWITVARQGMQAKGISAILYFIVWIVVGNFILLTLFLAILISTFQDEPTPTQEEIEEELAKEAAYDTMSQSTTQSELQGSVMAGPDANNALMQRVHERPENKLDSSTVRKMKTWLMMMGVEHGLTMQDMEELRAQLEHDYTANPARFQNGQDYLTEEENIHRQMMRSTQLHNKPSHRAPGLLSTQLSKRTSDPWRDKERTSAVRPSDNKANRLSAWLVTDAQNCDPNGVPVSSPRDKAYAQDVRSSAPAARNGVDDHMGAAGAVIPAVELLKFKAGTAQRNMLQHVASVGQPAPEEPAPQPVQSSKASARYPSPFAQFANQAVTAEALAAAQTNRHPADCPVAQPADDSTQPRANTIASMGSIHSLTRQQIAGSDLSLAQQHPDSSVLQGHRQSLIKSHSLSGTDDTTLSNLRALLQATAAPAHGDPLNHTQDPQLSAPQAGVPAAVPVPQPAAHMAQAQPQVEQERGSQVSRSSPDQEFLRQASSWTSSGSSGKEDPTVVGQPWFSDLDTIQVHVHPHSQGYPQQLAQIAPAPQPLSSLPPMPADLQPLKPHSRLRQWQVRREDAARGTSTQSLPSTPLRHPAPAQHARLASTASSSPDKQSVQRLYSNPLFGNPLYAGTHAATGGPAGRAKSAVTVTRSLLPGQEHLQGTQRVAAASAGHDRRRLNGCTSADWENPLFTGAWAPQGATQPATAASLPQQHRSRHQPGAGPVAEGTMHGDSEQGSALGIVLWPPTEASQQPAPIASDQYSEAVQAQAVLAVHGPAVLQLLSTLRRRRKQHIQQLVPAPRDCVLQGNWHEDPGSQGQPIGESMDSHTQALLTQHGHSLEHGTRGSRVSATSVRESSGRGRVKFHPEVPDTDSTQPDKPHMTDKEQEEAEELARLDAMNATMAEEKQKSHRYLESSAFWVLRPHHPARVWLSNLVEGPAFTNFILALIGGSSLVLAIQSPGMAQDTAYYQALRTLDIIFTTCFALEMALKLIAKGLVGHRGAYLRTPWDIFDGTIVVTSILALTPLAASLTIFRTLRLLRVLRPLRLLRQWRGMQLVVETLVCSMPSVGNVILFGVFLFSVFAILGVQLFSGRMGMCNQTATEEGPIEWRDQCTPGTFVCGPDDICNTGDTVERYWSRPFRNFDNIGNALLTLFSLATMDGFMGVIDNIIDVVGVNQQPKINNAPWMGLYVIAFIFLGAWFWVNLLVSVVVEYYTKLVQEKGDVLASKQAKEWIKLFKFNSPKTQDTWNQIPVPSNPIRALAYHIASHPKFDPCIMVVIVSNVLAMACDHWDPGDTFILVTTVLNFFFMACFIFEMVVKMLALGIRAYFAEHWNKLDFFIIVISIPDLISAVVPALRSLSFMTVFRVFRVARLFKLINKAKGLRTLFNTLISSLPAIFNVGSLLVLLMFIYTVLGMNVFGSTDRYTDPILNFNNFGTSLLTMFRVFTGDGWTDVMAKAFDCNEQGMQCNMVSPVSIVAGFFFPSFVIFGQFVMLNLVIAVILDNFIESAQSEGLLKTTNFVELLRMVITLKVFVRMLRLKVEDLKRRDALRKMPAGRFTDASANSSAIFNRFRALPGALSAASSHSFIGSGVLGKKDN